MHPLPSNVKIMIKRAQLLALEDTGGTMGLSRFTVLCGACIGLSHLTAPQQALLLVLSTGRKVEDPVNVRSEIIFLSRGEA